MATGLTWLILLSLLVLPPLHGNLLGYIAMGAAIIGLVAVWDLGAYREVFGRPWIWMIVGAYGCLAIAIVGVAKTAGETLTVVDFVPFLLVIPAAALFARARLAEPLSTIAALSLGGTLVSLAICLTQIALYHARRPGGWEMSPIHFGDFAVILGFLSLGGLLVPGARWRAMYWAGPAIGLVDGMLTGTRASLVVGVCLLPLAGYFVWRHGPGRRAALLLAGAVVVLLAVPLALSAEGSVGRSLGAYQVIDQVAHGDEVTDSSAAYRLDQYTAAVRAFFDAPVFGHGWRDQVQSALPYMSAEGKAGYAREHWGYIHDEFLSLAVGMGVFGILAWLLLMAYPIVAVRTAPRDAESAARTYLGLAVLVGIGVSGLTDVLFMTELPKVFFGFLPAAIILLRPAAVPAREASA
jgi:O-antigen ligase